jgi:hypothetical protein
VRRYIGWPAALVVAVSIASCGGTEPEATRVESWPEADALFHQEPRWLGSDGGISVDLGGDRSAWLFPDTFVALTSAHVRKESCLARNTVGLQTGSDPLTATMTFHWKTTAGMPESFFPDGRDACFEKDDAWFWPGGGTRIGDDGPLVVFLLRQRPARGGLGFEPAGWHGVLVRNPDDDPDAWTVESASTRPNRWGIQLGTPGVFTSGEWLYAFGSSDPFDVHLARWPLEQALAGDLREPEWWAAAGEFVPEKSLAKRPAVLFGEALPESVYEADERFAVLQTVGFGGAALGVRTAPSATGPWSALMELWHPPEADRDGVYVYGFEAHPHLSAGDAVAVTYATNAVEFADAVADDSLGYPRFAKLRLADD